MKPLHISLIILLFSGMVFLPEAQSSSLLKTGSVGEEVEEVQSLLYQLDYLAELPDGFYGEKTKGAVIEFQESLGLTADGVVGEKTWEALKIAAQLQPPPLLSQGDTDPAVHFLQKKLIEKGYLSQNQRDHFDAEITAAVKAFQEERGLDVDGVVGPHTWEALHKRPREEVQEKDTMVVTLVRPGDTGEQVLRLQEKLSQLHFYHSTLDGHFHLQTELSLRQFQEFAGLTVDGIAGPKTWSALDETKGQRPNTYIVQEGDTIWDLSRRWNTTVEEIQWQNNLSNINQIQMGTRLLIPGSFGVEERTIQKLHWNQVDSLFPEESIAVITDVKTGLSLRIQRLFGTNHADVEPLTAGDTQALLTIYGGEWSWERRAVVFQFNGYLVAASINGFPHDSQSIYHNNFPGHICLHFHGSRLHNSGHVDADHQEQVQVAGGKSWPLQIYRNH